MNIDLLTGKKFKYSKLNLKNANKYDNKKIIVQDWYLKDKVNYDSLSYDYNTNTFFSDFKSNNKCIRVLGTERQLYLFFIKKLSCEALQIKDEYEYKFKNNKEKNIYLQMYINNNKQVITINLI